MFLSLQPSWGSVNSSPARVYTVFNTRQAFIYQGRVILCNDLDRLMQPHEAYRALPAKVAQQVLKQVTQAWENFFAARKEYEAHPEQFLGRPRLPSYKHKQDGRNLLVYTIQAISRKGLKRGLIQPSRLPITVTTRQTSVEQVRIVPRKGYYVVEVIYERPIQPAEVDPALCAGVDLGINNLAAIASNKRGFVPRLVNGRRLKSMNQWYNKRKAQLQRKLGKARTTKQMERLTIRRNRQVQHELHSASKQIIALLVAEGIGTLVIGKNVNWKQSVEMGKCMNQNFVQIPHARFIEMLTYKAKLVGIQVIVTEESYTSKASFLDLDPIPVYGSDREGKSCFSGKRITRGMYRASDGRLIQADVNGAYNILRKGKPDAFHEAEGVAGYVVHPVRLALTTQIKQTASGQ